MKWGSSFSAKRLFQQRFSFGSPARPCG